MNNTQIPFKAALFDIDGTLIDSNQAHAESWTRALTHFGFQVEYQHVLIRIGKGGDKLIPELTGLEETSPQGKEISELRKKIFSEDFAPHLKPFDGARDLLVRLKQMGYILATTSSASPSDLKKLLKVLNAEDLFDHQVSPSEEDPSKPDPDVLEKAIDEIGCLAREAIMIGDTPYDLEAAEKLGILSVALRTGGWDDTALKLAYEIYDNPRHLLQEIETSLYCVKPEENELRHA